MLARLKPIGHQPTHSRLCISPQLPLFSPILMDTLIEPNTQPSCYASHTRVVHAAAIFPVIEDPAPDAPLFRPPRPYAGTEDGHAHACGVRVLENVERREKVC